MLSDVVLSYLARLRVGDGFYKLKRDNFADKRL